MKLRTKKGGKILKILSIILFKNLKILLIALSINKPQWHSILTTILCFFITHCSLGSSVFMHFRFNLGFLWKRSSVIYYIAFKTGKHHHHLIPVVVKLWMNEVFFTIFYRLFLRCYIHTQCSFFHGIIFRVWWKTELIYRMCH